MPTNAFPAPALNAEQQQAVAHGAGGAPGSPLLIIAGAGSGKTQTLAHRVARLVGAGADPTRVLLLTFSRRAAAELERRAGRVLAAATGRGAAATPPPLPWAGTFHSVGARLLRQYALRVGLPDNFTIHDRGDSEDLMALVRQERVAARATQSRFPAAATCVAIYSRAVNSEAPLPDVLAETYPWCAHLEHELQEIFDDYVAAKQAQHVLDFDDLLLYWAAMLGDAALAAEVGAQFDHVLVDEYQDTNRLQATILQRLKPDGTGVTVVGDDAQAIYGFRAATVRNILDFPRQYAPPATTIALTRNYRSTAPILAASNAVIALAAERFTKDLASDRGGGTQPRWVTVADESAQAQCVAEHVLAQRENGVGLKSQAVLFRTSSHSAQVELELTRRNIPFVKFGGLRFLDAAHVKDVLSVLRWLENPRGRVAGFRALRLLPGVGPATATRWLDAIDGGADAVATLVALAPPPACAEALPAFATLAARMRARRDDWPAQMDWLLEWYEPHAERLYDDAAVRVADLAQLRRIAGTYADRERFLTELTLDPPAAVSDEAGAGGKDDEYLTLSTIHSAKGQEWKTVQVLNCVDGCMPSDLATGRAADIEEERRLLYVAMTRARDELTLLIPQRFYVHQQRNMGDRYVQASRSRFLPDGLACHFVQEAWPAAPAALTVRDAAAATALDLPARMREAWKRARTAPA